MTDMRDDLLEQVVDELQTLPPADERAVARIVRAATAGAAGAGQRAAGTTWWRSPVPRAAAAGFALAAGLAGFWAGDLVRRGWRPDAAGAYERLPEPAQFAALPAAHRPPPAPAPTQFVLNAPHASRVALVGDFNAWDESATQLVRASATGIWTVTVPLSAGRHTYAFMVDDTVWTLDPRAPTTHDPDFGTASSVVLVGTP